MSTVQISDAGGLSYQNGSIHSLTGALVQDGINGSEVSPGTYSFNFGTIPDGDYSFSASIDGQLAFAERVTISAGRTINPVASQDSVSVTGLATTVQLANIPQYDQPQAATWIDGNGQTRTETVTISRP